MNPPALGHGNYHIPFFLLYMKRMEKLSWYSPENAGTTINPYDIVVRNWTLWHWDTALAIEPLGPGPF